MDRCGWTVRYHKPHVQQSSGCVVSLVIKLVTSRWVFVCAVRRQRAFGVIAAIQLGPCSVPLLSGGVVLGLDFDAKKMTVDRRLDMPICVAALVTLLVTCAPPVASTADIVCSVRASLVCQCYLYRTGHGLTVGKMWENKSQEPKQSLSRS